MENFKPFIVAVKNLLLEKIEKKELNIPAKRISSSNIFDFNNEQGELRYYIDKDIVDKLPPDLIKQIESIWILHQQSSNP